MARPPKDGVDYFNKDTDFYSDDKVRLIRAEFGAKGMYILDYLLCEIYGKYGYFLPWDKNKCFLVSDGAGCGCSPECIQEVVNGCIRCSFFDERVFNLFGVLTSAGIQRRYLRMLNNRDYIEFITEYWLLEIDRKKDVPTGILNKLAFKSIKSTGNPDKSTGNPDKSTGNPQRKVKESKVKESIYYMHEAANAASVPDNSDIVASIPLNDGSVFEIRQPDVDHYQQLYPAISVNDELLKMQGWCEANPRNRKTRQGIKRFIASWLSRAQDRAPVQRKKVNTNGQSDYDPYDPNESW